uniref:S-adenosylmethionine-dependent methyltransferase n=1 Tax=Moniliophthora roreri TaxID=221103 RepID=A0A0W0FVF1_MONRR
MLNVDNGLQNPSCLSGLDISTLFSPTARLPAIKQLESLLSEEGLENLHSLHGHLSYLRHIYNPPVRGSRRIRREMVFPLRQKVLGAEPETYYQLPNSSTTELPSLRTDAFERSYALRWLSALLRAAQRVEVSEENDETRNNLFVSLIDTAAALLALCSGTSGAGVITRDFVFRATPSESISSLPTHSRYPEQVGVTLTDCSLDNADFGSVGAQTWGGACVLAEEIVRTPWIFFPGVAAGANSQQPNPSTRHFRILELGAGTGLVSLVTTKLIQGIIQPESKIGEDLGQQSRVEIVATDYYPSVLKNLAANVEANFPNLAQGNAESRVCLSTCVLDWEAFHNSDLSSQQTPLSHPFDLILGADIIYEPLHAQWIRHCLVKLLRRPLVAQANTELIAFFHLMIPLRPSFVVESETVERVFPFADLREVDAGTSEGHLDLVIFTKEIILCDAAVATDEAGDDVREYNMDDDEGVQYAYYIIGWGRPQAWLL